MQDNFILIMMVNKIIKFTQMVKLFIDSLDNTHARDKTSSPCENLNINGIWFKKWLEITNQWILSGWKCISLLTYLLCAYLY